MGIPNQNAEGQTLQGRRSAFNSLLAQDDGISREAEGFVILPVEIIRLSSKAAVDKNFARISRAARGLGYTKKQWSTRKGYSPYEAFVIYKIINDAWRQPAKVNQADFLLMEFEAAARDLGDDCMTFSEAGKLLGKKPENRKSAWTITAFPFEVAPQQERYRQWLKQPMALRKDVEDAFVNLP